MGPASVKATATIQNQQRRHRMRRPRWDSLLLALDANNSREEDALALSRPPHFTDPQQTRDKFPYSFNLQRQRFSALLVMVNSTVNLARAAIEHPLIYSWGWMYTNPYPRDIPNSDFDYIMESTEHVFDKQGNRIRYHYPYPQPPPVEYDLSAEPRGSMETHRLLLDYLGLTGKRDCAISRKFLRSLKGQVHEIRTADSWKHFRDSILQEIGQHPLDTAVSLGLGGLLGLENVKELNKWVTELACFLSIIEYLIRRQPFSGLEESEIEQINAKIESDEAPAAAAVLARAEFTVRLQDPQFTSVDARLLKALGLKAVREPYENPFIRHGALLFAIHLPYDAVWNYAFKNNDPTIYIGDHAKISKGKCMAAALEEARRKADPAYLEEAERVSVAANAFIDFRALRHLEFPRGSRGHDVFSSNTFLHHPVRRASAQGADVEMEDP